MRDRWIGASLSFIGGVLAIGLNASVQAGPLAAHGSVQSGTAQAEALGVETERIETVRIEKVRDDTTRRGRCRQAKGVGSAPTERLAKLQAWERVAQATGNWPVPADTFSNERYQCRKAGVTWECRSLIEICKPA